MNERTPEHRARTWISALLGRLDRFAFRELDLRATARGWHVAAGPRFQRTYRDPRWDSVQECPACHGAGHEGARPCAGCEGAGTVHLPIATLIGMS